VEVLAACRGEMHREEVVLAKDSWWWQWSEGTIGEGATMNSEDEEGAIVDAQSEERRTKTRKVKK